MQVRDVLFVEDLVNAFLLAWDNIGTLSGNAYNVGGGIDRTVSLLELVDLIATLNGVRPRVYFDISRTGDQRYYVSDISKLGAATGWRPRVSVRDGVRRLNEWLIDARTMRPAEIIAS
jgi:CDP-paratose 2-epimerase